VSSGPALFGKSLPLIPGNHACYGANLAGPGYTSRGSQHYRQQDYTFVGSAIPYDARRRSHADHPQDRLLPPARARRLRCQIRRAGRNHSVPSGTGMRRIIRSVITHIPRGKEPLAHHPSGMMSRQMRRRTTSPAAGVNRRADWCLRADRGHAGPGREDGVPLRPARRRSVAWPGARAAQPDPAGDRAGSFRPAPRRR
jgi:hypothetical protein